MTDLAIRERVAREVMGRTDCYRAREAVRYLEDDETQIVFEQHDSGDILAISLYTQCPAYEIDISAAWQVEERIIDLGLVVEYGRALQEIVKAERGMTVNSMSISGPINTFQTAHATPMQRCKAALNAMEAAK